MAVSLKPGEFTLILDEKSKQALFKRMDGLLDIEKEEAVRRGLRQGASIIVKAGKTNYYASGLKKGSEKNQKYKAKPGHLIDSAGVSTSGKAMKVWGGFKRPQGAAAHLLDRGTQERYKKNGAKTGKIKATLFWYNAYQQNKAAASDKIIKVIDKTVEAIWNYGR